MAEKPNFSFDKLYEQVIYFNKVAGEINTNFGIRNVYNHAHDMKQIMDDLHNRFSLDKSMEMSINKYDTNLVCSGMNKAYNDFVQAYNNFKNACEEAGIKNGREFDNKLSVAQKNNININDIVAQKNNINNIKLSLSAASEEFLYSLEDFSRICYDVEKNRIAEKSGNKVSGQLKKVNNISNNEQHKSDKQQSL